MVAPAGGFRLLGGGGVAIVVWGAGFSFLGRDYALGNGSMRFSGYLS